MKLSHLGLLDRVCGREVWKQRSLLGRIDLMCRFYRIGHSERLRTGKKRG